MAIVAIDFLRGPDLSSWFIAREGLSHGGYSHCALVLADGRYLDARSDVLDGVPAGVHIRKPETEKWIRKRRVWKEVSQDVYNEFERNARNKIGDAYAKRAIWQFITGKPVVINGQYVCSMFVINECQHVKLVKFPLVVEAHELSPDDALLVLDASRFTVDAEQIWSG